MKLSKAQKLLVLSALGIFREINQIPHPEPDTDLDKRDMAIGKWFEAQTGSEGGGFAAFSADISFVNETLIAAAELIIAQEEPPEEVPPIVSVPDSPRLH